ncbi:YheC/YheD family protein [Bacillus horti]|uniref:YheC/YheD family protein n=1 Tax=Caldalkalibacillus horti TaxID=77523 RepID=A0ABT9VWE1_9BACI|nr:YheC/YheD family protein [Bacillus horti]MDQ0165184.1 hypothetical protein [Bacillus horti]
MSALYTVSIKAHKASKNRIFLGPEFSSHYKRGEIITVHYGLEQVQAIVTPIKNSEHVIFSKDVWDRLSLPFPHKLHVKTDHEKISLGPLVGIMTTNFTPSSKAPLGPRTDFFKEYIVCQKYVPSSYFLFSPLDVSTVSNRVSGYFLIQNKGKKIWKKYSVPFPNVVYNRVFRRGEKMSVVKHGRAILENAGAKVFNPFTFNKWNIHELISTNPAVQEYLPESILDPSLQDLKRLLRKHKMIYLKPAEGYMGLGIIQINKNPEKGISCRFNRHGKNHLKPYPSMKLFIKQFFKGRSLKKYIAQQGISLLQNAGRNIDFRVHVNKDEHGQWNMTGIAGKISGKGSVTTHIRTGGHVLSFDSIMEKFFSKETQNKIYQELKQAVLTLAQVIEDSLPGYVGEIGFDIGLDATGHPWMFEANSQPGRHVFALPELKEWDVITRRNILDYSLFLSGFTKKEVHAS